MNWIVLLAALFLIITEALYEGLKMQGKHALSSRIETFYLTVVTIVFFAFLCGIQTPFKYHYIEFWKVIVGYVFLRFAIFDIVWNISAGTPVNFVGTTKDSDKIIQWLMCKGVPMHFINYARFIAFLWGMSWLIF